MSTASVIILICIAVVIVLGYLLKINFGLLGIAAAFICGTLLVGLSPGKLIGMWGTKLFFQMFSITFFYAFAVNNGTLELLARKLVYVTRRTAFLIPVILFVVSGVLAGIGPGSISMFLIITPIVMQVAKQTGMRTGLAAVVVACGVNSGAWSPLTVNGITLRGIIETSGYAAGEAASYGLVLFRNMLIASLVFFAIAYAVYRGWTCKAMEGEKPKAFTKQQKTSLTLIVILTALIVLPPVCKTLFGGAVFSWLGSNMDPTFLAVVFGVVSIILKAGDEKKAIAGVPWNTIIMVCGIGMLISVASEAGTMAYISDYIGRSFSASALPYVMSIAASVMSLFASTMGVVIPTLYPIIYAICAATGANPAVLFSVVPIAATSAGNSPFSLFGGLVLATLDEKEKTKCLWSSSSFPLPWL